MEQLIPYAGLMAVIVASSLRRDAERRRQDYITAAVFLAYGIAGGLLNELIPHLRPQTVDAQLLAADRMLGFDTVRIAHMLCGTSARFWTLSLAYMALPLAINAAWIAEQSTQLRRACIVAGCACFAFYCAFPAVGPGWYDWVHGTAGMFPRNCMPSMHFGWALLLALNARSRWLAAALWAYAALIALATIGLGQHYVCDLIAAVPFTLAVQWMTGERAVVRRFGLEAQNG
jgi:membrane-associated phospholipid phosphatase